MAGFCTKCGAPLASSTGFCTSCGTPVSAGVAPPQPSYPPAQPPMASPPAGFPPAAAYPPPANSGGALKIVLIVVAVVVVLGGLAAAAIAFAAWRVARTVTVDSKGGQVSVSVPGGGTISAGDSTASDADLGVPVYPGAVREKGGMEMNSAAASMVMAHFVTGDSASQVVNFYKGKMGDGAIAVSTGNGTVLNSGGKDTDRIMVTVGPGSGDDAGKTTIVIMHTKKSG